MDELKRQIESAMWAGDIDMLHQLAPCDCCCDEHTMGPTCPAWAWGGCRGRDSMTRNEMQSWEEHYAKHYGLTFEEFYNLPKTEK